MTLLETARHFDLKTDKYDEFTAGHTYLPHYEKLFNPYKERRINFLEIGVLAGESLKLWSKYFSNSHIFGIDLFEREYDNISKKTGLSIDHVKDYLKDYNNISLFKANSTHTYEINNLNLPKLDIILDDGSHTPEHQCSTFNNFYPFLNEGGLYIIEDVNVDNIEYLTNTLSSYEPIEVFNLAHEAKDVSKHANVFLAIKK